MKRTPLTDIHISLGAKMAEFAGFFMPISYSGINNEHLAVRGRAGVFDVSHMGEFILNGPGALPLIQSVATNDASKLTPGKVQYSCMTNDQGGIVDDLLVYRLDEQSFMLVVNASNIEKDWEWIEKHNTFGAGMHDISGKTALLAVQGLRAGEILQKLTGTELVTMKYYTFARGNLAGVDNVLISATGYTGSGGFELYFDSGNAQHVWKEIFAAGKEFDIVPAGLGARDTLRLEMGYCLYGNDIDDTTTPLEAGLGWITKLNKDFTASGILCKQKEEGVKKKLVGFEMQDRGIPRHGNPILDNEGKQSGIVTSGTQSPSLKKAIGMGYVPSGSAAEGTEITIDVRGRRHRAVVVGMPFYATVSAGK